MKEIDRHDIIDYLQTSIKEDMNWFHFMNIMKDTADRIEN